MEILFLGSWIEVVMKKEKVVGKKRLFIRIFFPPTHRHFTLSLLVVFLFDFIISANTTMQKATAVCLSITSLSFISVRLNQVQFSFTFSLFKTPNFPSLLLFFAPISKLISTDLTVFGLYSPPHSPY